MTGKVEEVRGRQVVIRFDGGRCIHSRNCVLGRPDVFVPNVEGEWIHPDRATPDEVAHLALVCPSGAITYERLDGGPQEAPPKVNTVHVRENGPLALHAPHAVADQPPALRATLCRCGASQNKPWCDGSHTGIGFQATGEPATKQSAAARIARWTSHDYPHCGRAPQARRPHRTGLRHGANHQSHHRDLALPLRSLGQQAVLRRQSSQDRIQELS